MLGKRSHPHNTGIPAGSFTLEHETIVEQWKEENGKSRISAKKREELTAPTWAAKNLAYDTIKAL